MKQKLIDLKLLLQRDRKMQAFAIMGVVVLMLYFIIDNKGNGGRRSFIPDQMEQDTSNVRLNSDESYRDLMQRVSGDLNELKVTSAQNADEIKKTKSDLLIYEQRTAEIFKKVLERIQETDGAGNRTGGSANPQEAYDSAGNIDQVNLDPNAQKQTDEIESWGGMTDTKDPLPPPAPQVAVARVSPGDSVRVKLLAGVNAPTDGTPYPVVFQLVSDVYGPDGSTLGLGQARLVAAAQGSLVDSRALFRLTSLSIQFPNGRRKEIAVDGWIVGEDGIRGMSGVTIDPIGKAIGGTVLAGTIQGIGQGFAQAQMTTTNHGYGGQTQLITGDVGTYAAGHGLAQGANLWSSIIKERLSMLVPQVQVMSGREGTAVFAHAFSVRGLFEAYGSEDETFSSLD